MHRNKKHKFVNQIVMISIICLSVRLGDTLDLILLLDGVGVGGFLGAIDDLISEALGNGLDIAESGQTGADGDQVQGLVDATERRDIDGLTTNDTSGTDTGGIFTGTTGLDGVGQDLERVLVGQQMNDLEGVLDDTDSELLLTVVAAVHHQRASETLDDGAGGLTEALLLVATSSVGNPHLSALLGHGDIVHEGQIGDGDVVIGPLAEKFSFSHD